MHELARDIASASLAGVLIWWILAKLIPALEALRKDVISEMRRVERAMDRQSMVDLLKIASVPQITDDFKDKVEALMKEIEELHKVP